MRPGPEWLPAVRGELDYRGRLWRLTEQDELGAASGIAYRKSRRIEPILSAFATEPATLEKRALRRIGKDQIQARETGRLHLFAPAIYEPLALVAGYPPRAAHRGPPFRHDTLINRCALCRRAGRLAGRNDVSDGEGTAGSDCDTRDGKAA